MVQRSLVESHDRVGLYRSCGEPLTAVAERVSACAPELTEQGTPVRYLQTIFLPEDETCLYLFDAASEADVRAAVERAGIGFDRIGPAEQIGATTLMNGG